jgi:hypothetical protein
MVKQKEGGKEPSTNQKINPSRGWGQKCTFVNATNTIGYIKEHQGPNIDEVEKAYRENPPRKEKKITPRSASCLVA